MNRKSFVASSLCVRSHPKRISVEGGTSLSVVHIDFFHSLPSSTSPMDKTRTIRRPITPEHGVNASVDGGKTGHPCEGVMCLLVPSKVT